MVKSLAYWNESRSRWGQLYSVNLKIAVGSPKTGECCADYNKKPGYVASFYFDILKGV